MKQAVLDAIQMTSEAMAEAGYYAGVLDARWAEIAVEQAQDDSAMDIFWALRAKLGAN